MPYYSCRELNRRAEGDEMKQKWVDDGYVKALKDMKEMLNDTIANHCDLGGDFKDMTWSDLISKIDKKIKEMTEA